MSHRSGRLAVVSLSLGLLSLTGCGQSGPAKVETHPVRFDLTYRGRPTPGALVAFHPVTPTEGAPAPRGVVTRDGQLKVSTFNGGDGAPEGEYVLTIQWSPLVKREGEVVQGPNVLPRKYTSPQTSGLRIRVASGENQIAPVRL